MPRYELGDKIGAYILPTSTTAGAQPSGQASGPPPGKVDQKAHFAGVDANTGSVLFTLDPIDPATSNPMAQVHVVWVPTNTPFPSTAQQFMAPHLHRSSVPVASNGATATTPAATAPAQAAPMTPNQPAAAAPAAAAATAPAQAQATGAPAATTISVPVNANVQRGVPYIAQAIHEYAQ